MHRWSRSLVAIIVFAAFASLAGSLPATAQAPPWVALSDGTLDPRFGVDGLAIIPGGEEFDPSAGALQPDGKIVVAVTGRLLRYNVDGSLDAGFGADGIATSALSARGTITMQPDGKFLTLARNRSDQLVRYNPDWSLDTSFGSDGLVTAPGPLTAFALMSDGRIVVAGSVVNGSTTRMAVSRYGDDGSPDPTFASGGSVALETASVAGAAIAVVLVRPDGRIVLVGTGYGPFSGGRSDFVVLQLQGDGTFDAGFGNNGVVVREFEGRIDRATSAILTGDGRIVAGGTVGANRVGTPFDFGLMRFLADGSLDGTFGVGGRVRTTIRTRVNMDTSSGIIRLAVQSDGRIVAAGRVQPVMAVSDYALVRYNANGTLDPGFGVGGIVVTDVDNRGEEPFDLLIQPDQQIIVTALAGGSGPDFCNCAGFPLVARYRNDSARGVFGAAVRPVPAHIEADHYDLGGQGTGYYDTTPGSENGPFVFRTDEVDIKVSAEGGHAVGWLMAGEWLAYTVDVPAAGRYSISARVGSMLPGRSFHIAVGGTDVTGPIAVPQVGNWDTYRTVNSPSFQLSAGRQVLRVVVGPTDWLDFHGFDIAAAQGARARDGDFDGDGHADITVFAPGNATWWVLRSDSNYSTGSAFQWGAAGDLIEPGDYDGDGRTDFAIYRPSSGTWYVLQSSTAFTTYISLEWGLSGDVPMPADYDGDGKTDFAVYRPQTATWWILQSSTGSATYVAYQWGAAADKPVPADYDGDGRADLAIYRPSTARWWVLQSSTDYSTYVSYQWGAAGDVPVPADYDGDGKVDYAIFRPSTGTWWMLRSSTNNTTYASVPWGGAADVPVPADYDGDDKADAAVFRPSTGTWLVLRSETSTSAVYQWGVDTDVPVLQRQ